MSIEVYCDGAIEPKNPGGIPAYGCAVYGDGEIIAELNGLVPVHSDDDRTNNVAEYYAVVMALDYLHNTKLTEDKVTIIADSQLIINQLSGKWKVKADNLKSHYFEILRLEAFFRLSISYEWVRREQNEYADMLSRRSYENEYR